MHTIDLDTPQKLADFKLCLRRALNTWDRAPAWIVELCDTLNGEIGQINVKDPQAQPKASIQSQLMTQALIGAAVRSVLGAQSVVAIEHATSILDTPQAQPEQAQPESEFQESITASGTHPTILVYTLTKTTRRLTFDIISQAEAVTWRGDDDGAYFKFVASNGYEVISRSRMDIQTERIWLLGAKRDEEQRSGTMVFSSEAKRDSAYVKFIQALDEWAKSTGGIVLRVPSEPQSNYQPASAASEGGGL